MAPGYRPGWSLCGNCHMWKADQAFVRGRYRRDSPYWKRLGFSWKRFRTCNRCSRVYHRQGQMSLAEFVNSYGAEDHDLCVFSPARFECVPKSLTTSTD